MGAKLRTVYILYQAQILIRTAGYHPWHGLYAEFGVHRADGIDNLPYHPYGHIPQFLAEVVAVSAVPPCTVGCPHHIHTAGGPYGIGHAELADGIVYPAFPLIGGGSQGVAPHPHFGYRETCLVGCLLIRHDGLLAVVTAHGEYHGLQSECLVLVGPLLRRAMLQ